MICPINRDVILLSRRGEPATAADADIARDLLETLRAHAEECVGMAANMIGENKRIIAFYDEGRYEVMLNPELMKKSGAYDTEEGCLSLDGKRPTVRYRSIKVRWQTVDGKPRIKTFEGFTAQIIQHELDHLEGILI
ncbi:MAG: peptide deformylase [Clostridia bacterium]|nr:peptide deformylase [Clostridia bacterium]